MKQLRHHATTLLDNLNVIHAGRLDLINHHILKGLQTTLKPRYLNLHILKTTDELEYVITCRTTKPPKQEWRQAIAACEIINPHPYANDDACLWSIAVRNTLITIDAVPPHLQDEVQALITDYQDALTKRKHNSPIPAR